MKKVYTFASGLILSSLFFVSAAFAGVPSVTSVTETSTPVGGGGTYYDNGETITFTVTFNEAVNVAGDPHVNFVSRGLTEEAIYNGTGSGTTTLEFDYTVGTGINDWNGVTVERIETLAGESIQSVSTAQDLAPEDFTDVDFNSLFVDGEAPEYSSLTISSTDGNVSGGTRYLKAGDTFSLQLDLNSADTWGTNAAEVTIGAGAAQNLNFTESSTGEKTTETISSNGTFLDGQTGSLTVTDLSFDDKAGKAITSLPGFPLSPAVPIVVDTTAPAIAFLDDVATGPTTSDTIQIGVNDTNPDTTTYEYGFSSDATCDAGDTFGNAFTSGGSFNITSETNNGDYLCVRATDLALNTSYQLSANTLNIDVNAPVFTVNDDVNGSLNNNDTINVSVADDNPDTGTYEYGFSSDAVCNGSDTFGNAFTSGANFSISSEANNGDYLCFVATDALGQTSYQLSANTLNIDVTDPVLTIVSNVDTGPTMSDTINVTVADTNADTGSYEYGFSSDAVCNASDTFGNAFTTGVDFFITSEANNGDYLCMTASDLAGNTVYALSANTLNIDSTDPVITINNDVNATLNNGDTINVTVTEGNPDTGSYEYGFSSDAVCDAGDTFGNAFTSGADFVISSEANNGDYLCFRASDTSANTTYQLSANTLNIDVTDPVLTITDDVLAGPVTSDDVIFTVTDTNADTSTYEYGFSSDAVCNASDTFGNAFTSGGTNTFNTETNNGNYVCAIATDLAGNTVYALSANVLYIDITDPVFSNIGVSSDNAFDSSYGNASSTLTFTLTLTAADSFNGPGAGTGRISFDIGGTNRTVDFSDSASGTQKTTYTATYALAGENGAITINGIDFQDNAGNTMTGFAAGAPTPTVIIDTDAPGLQTVNVSTSGNAGWARNNQEVTYQLNFDEDISLNTLNSATVANNASTLDTEFNPAGFVTSSNIVFEVDNGDNGTIDVNSADFVIQDRAGNQTSIDETTINGLVAGVDQITADTTDPVVSNVSIISNNALDTSLAKTNDTITVSFDTADNLSPTTSFANTGNLTRNHILNSSISTFTMAAGVGTGNSIARFTDGTETSETVVPFAFRIQDEAGNNTDTSSVTDASSVRFDRVNPLVQAVTISATSADGSADTSDIPTYYAKQNDTLDFSFQTCDYVDNDNQAPTGTLFGQAVTLTDDGLSADACTTGGGNAGFWRDWSTQLTGIDGTEGTVTFDILVIDNAGNGDGATNPEVHVTGTTDGTSVIFDKTIPTLPTVVNDILGDETATFKQRDNAVFSWSGDTDPNSSGADLVAGIFKYLIRLTNPANGGEDHRGTATVPEEVFSRSFNGTTSNIPDPGQTKIPARDETDPYEFRMIVVDKAGNHSHGNITAFDWAGAGISYTQPYTIGISGYVTNEIGNAIEAAQVQVASRYGEVCDTGKELCVGATDSNGFYSIVLKKEQNYNITYFKPGYLLYKTENRIDLDDINQDISFSEILTLEKQRVNPAITIGTDLQFTNPNDENELLGTEIYVSTLSGEITAVNINQNRDMTITSLSTISSVTSNNPDVVIVDNGDNTFTLTGTGKIKTNDGAKQTFTNNPLNLGLEIVEGNGKGSFSGSISYNPNKVAKIWTKEEVLADNARIDKGWPARIKKYQNSNGHEIFAGYIPGRLSMEKLSQKRTIVRKPRTAQAIYQKAQQQALVATEKKTLPKLNLRRRTAEEAYKSTLAQKRHQAKYVNRFERTRKAIPKESNMKHKHHDNPLISIRGHSIRSSNLVN